MANPWLDMFLGNTAGNAGMDLLQSPRTNGLNIPSISSIAPSLSGLDALIAQFPDIFDAIMNGNTTNAGGTGTTATSGPNGASAVSGGRSARMGRPGGGPPVPGARQPMGGMNGYPNMRNAGGALGAAMNTQPRAGGFTGMVDRLRQAERMAKRADRGTRGDQATSNADGGTVRMGNVNDPNAHINIDVSGGTQVERAQRARRRGY
jgi:hypothetical protein